MSTAAYERRLCSGASGFRAREFVMPSGLAQRRVSARLKRMHRAISEQKSYICRVPEAERRERAETNLVSLLHDRDNLRNWLRSRGLIEEM
jgi:hypothetical protein